MTIENPNKKLSRLWFLKALGIIDIIEVHVKAKVESFGDKGLLTNFDINISLRFLRTIICAKTKPRAKI